MTTDCLTNRQARSSRPQSGPALVSWAPFPFPPGSTSTPCFGPHVDKKSREQFEIRTHKRIIDITEPNPRTVEALNRLVVPAGVFVKIKA